MEDGIILFKFKKNTLQNHSRIFEYLYEIDPLVSIFPTTLTEMLGILYLGLFYHLLELAGS